MYKTKEETNANTVAVELLFLATVIYTEESRDIATCDIPGAFMRRYRIYAPFLTASEIANKSEHGKIHKICIPRKRETNRLRKIENGAIWDTTGNLIVLERF